MAHPTTHAATARRPDEAPSRPAGRGEARILDGPIRLDAVRAALATPDAAVGALATFTGVVRADPGPTGGRVERLEFECYPEMATAELRRIRAEAIERFALAGLTIHHRTGVLQVGEDIVLVAAAAAHRREAFAAAAWAMDEIKRRVPLWKREVGPDGATRWVPGDSCRCMD